METIQYGRYLYNTARIIMYPVAAIKNYALGTSMTLIKYAIGGWAVVVVDTILYTHWISSMVCGVRRWFRPKHYSDYVYCDELT